MLVPPQDYSDEDLEYAGSDAEASPYPSSDEGEEEAYADDDAAQPQSALVQKSKAYTIIDKPSLQRIQARQSFCT